MTDELRDKAVEKFWELELKYHGDKLIENWRSATDWKRVWKLAAKRNRARLHVAAHIVAKQAIELAELREKLDRYEQNS